MGTHCLRTWSVTQKAVSLSSGEAELMALVKATSEAIGVQQLAECWGIRLDLAVFVDSSAALAVTARKGNGKLRHVRIGHLWIQELAESESVQFRKVRGVANPADLMTKHLAGVKSAELAAALSQQPRTGHASCRIALDSLMTQRTHVFPFGALSNGLAPEGETRCPWGPKREKKPTEARKDRKN